MNTIRRLGELPSSTLSALNKSRTTASSSVDSIEPTADAMGLVEDATAAALEEAFGVARDRGFEQGMQDAQREIDRRYEQLEKKLNEDYQQRTEKLLQERKEFVVHTTEFLKKTGDWLEQAEQLAIEAAYASLLRIMSEAPVSKELIESVCKKVIREHADSSASLRLSEEDASSINKENYGVSIEIDPALTAGQFVLKSARGDLQSGIDIRLEAMKQAYLGSLRAKDAI